jgi:myo-inositol catabolism protein IolH
MMRYAGRVDDVAVADVRPVVEAVGDVHVRELPPGVDARVHQHNEIGNGEVDWDEFFSTLREVEFDGVATVCVFGWEEDADGIHRRMLERVCTELGG